MADFPVCPSSERTESELPPFCRGAFKPGRFYRKVVSANLFAETLSNLIDCTAQSLSRFATAPFTQGSPSVYPPACFNCTPNSNMSVCLLMPITLIVHCPLSIVHCQLSPHLPVRGREPYPPSKLWSNSNRAALMSNRL